MKLGSTPLSEAFLRGPQEHTGPAPCPIVDVHSHPLPFDGGYLPSAPADRFVSALEKNGVSLVLVSSHTALSSPQAGVLPDIDVVGRCPERMKAWYTFNPRHDTLEHAKAVMEAHPGVFVGFKLHPQWHQVALTEPTYAPVLAWCEEMAWPVLCHTWKGNPLCGPQPVGAIMARHPSLLFFAGHSLYDDWQSACDIAMQYPNFYLELTAAGAVRGAVERMVGLVGSERLLFGTDFPWFGTMHGVGCLLSADICDDDRRNILYRNACRALGHLTWLSEFPGLEIHV